MSRGLLCLKWGTSEPQCIPRDNMTNLLEYHHPHYYTQQYKARASLSMATSSNPVMVPTILQLPVEIRDCIYLYLLQPQNVSTTPGRARPRSTNPRELYCPSRVSYQVDALPSIVPTLGLLSCCHQIRAELQQLLIREGTNERTKPIFKLDCILDRFLISPTWISLPTSLAAVHLLEINIRVRYMRKDDSSGTEQLVILFPKLFELLYRLFHHGPHFYKRQWKAQVSINNLTLNFHDEFTKREEQCQGGSISDAKVNPLQISVQRIEQCLLGLDRYGLLRGRVKTINIRFGDHRKEVKVSCGTVGRARITTSSEWLAWAYRWPKDDMFHPLDFT